MRCSEYGDAFVAQDTNSMEWLVLKMKVDGQKSNYSLVSCYEKTKQYSSCLNVKTACYIEGKGAFWVSPG